MPPKVAHLPGRAVYVQYIHLDWLLAANFMAISTENEEWHTRHYVQYMYTYRTIYGSKFERSNILVFGDLCYNRFAAHKFEVLCFQVLGLPSAMQAGSTCAVVIVSGTIVAIHHTKCSAKGLVPGPSLGNINPNHQYWPFCGGEGSQVLALIKLPNHFTALAQVGT